MSSDYSPSSDRRSSRRGGRSRGGRSRGSSHSSRQETPAKPKKLTLWQKIAGFFTGKTASSSSSASSSRTAGGATRTSERAERSDRSQRPERAERPAKAERPSGFRKPEIVEVTSARIYVGNLSFDATESDLVELFNGVGAVQNVEVVSNKYTQKSKGFAFVQMQSVDEAKRAVNELHDKEYLGRKLVVSGAKAVEEKRSERSRQADEQPQQAEEQPGQPAEQ